jgi:DNA polymerase-1
MLRQIQRVHSPDLIAVVMDAPGPTFRDELYAHYKANREAMPDDLQVQIPPLMEMVRALGITLLRESGVEADDVIGTLARRAHAAGIETLIASSDKDMSQLVNDRIRVFDGISGRMLDAAGVLDKFGVPPERIIDWLTLVGDTSDNIPGVPGVGPKTAAKWLGEYGSLDAIVARADEIKGKIGEKLRAHIDQLPLSRQLATIHCDVPLDERPENMRPGAPDVAALTRLAEQLEIRSLLKGIGTAAATDADPASGAALPAEPADPPPARLPDPVTRNYQTIVSAEQLAHWLQRIESAELVAFDTETTSLDYMQAEIVGLSFALACR